MQQDDVGPQVGSEMKRKAVWAMGWALVAMIIYIWVRFEFGFGLGAVVALFHDVLITAGVCHLLGFQINMTIVAALMTIVGYSVNDTIVIFDRVRENVRLLRNKSFLEICNHSMNQTLSRTLLTNFLTFVSVLCLMVFGGGAIKDFSVAMFIGMIAGTYSTIYIATPVVLLWYRFKTPDLGKAPAR
jgi:preprotein translocase SecF subunit